jgi:Abortive infection alpha
LNLSPARRWRSLGCSGRRPGCTLLEEGAREEDDGLRDKWANLLANGLAAGADGVPRAYAEVLRQLEPVEARILDAMAEDKGTFLGANSGTRMGKDEMKDLPLTGLVNLERLGLIVLGPVLPTPPGKRRLSETDALRVMRLTQFGISFIMACQAPKPAESEPHA